MIWYLSGEVGRVENEAVLVGVDNRIELWNVKTWSEYKNITDKKADEIAEKLSEK
jgi:MraZ protein